MSFVSRFRPHMAVLRAHPFGYGIGTVVAVGAVVVGVHAVTRPPAVPATVAETAHVTLASVADLSSTAGPLPVTGKVTSLSEADILAQVSGEVVTLNHTIGDQVAAGALIGTFENSGQRAAVTQAEGALAAAEAARSGVSPADIAAAARNAYVSAYTTLDSTLATDIDVFFGNPTAVGPTFLIDPSPFNADHFPRARDALAQSMDAWKAALASVATADPQQLLAQADAVTKQAAALAVDIATAATKHTTSATSAELTALATARTSITSVQASITTAEQTYLSQGTSASAGADAAVQEAQGALAAAQANLEKTYIRSPISGTIISLPITQGDFVSAAAPVATVSNPSALYLDIQVTPADAKTLSVGAAATIEGGTVGVVTFIAPAIDPASGKIEVKVGISGDQSALTSGEVVSATLARAAHAARTPQADLTIPIIAAKITPDGPVVFTAEATSTSAGQATVLVAHPITLGAILGDQVVVAAGLAPAMIVVTDARGLSAGEAVIVASSTPAASASAPL